MRLTRQTNYAMRILMYCAANNDRLSRIPEIAHAYSVSELFLFKILQPLVEQGMIETVRGRNGGVRLGRPADQITLFDVVRVTEESFSMAECFDSDTDCPLVDSCALNSALREGFNVFLN
ncbi:MAG: iron-responsive transcriptional regulator, partial [Proteobacteria bacterium]